MTNCELPANPPDPWQVLFCMFLLQETVIALFWKE